MKNIKLRKLAISLIALGVVLVPSANADTYAINKDTAVFYQSSEEGKVVGYLNAGTKVNDVITGDNGYILINQDNNLGYVKMDDLTVVDYNTPEVKTYRRLDILRATESVKLRKGPSTEYDEIMTIQGKTEVDCIGVAENGWYLIRVNGHIGYASPDYFKAFSDYSMNNYQMDYGSLGFICNAYTTDKVQLRSGPSKESFPITKLGKWSFLRLLQDHGDFYLVLTNDYCYGYVSKDYLHLLNNEKYVVIDLSSQTTTLYNGNNVMIQDYCVTGKGKYQTGIGVFKIKSKERDRYLNGTNADGSTYHSFVHYWMPFNGGQGLHDASWRGNFGPSINSSSHGCDNLDSIPRYMINKYGEIYELSTAEYIYYNVDVGTKVIGKK